MSTHPRLLAYADTPTQTHPLILVVGREASADAKIVDGIGDYDFDTVKSRFWTTAYSTIASVGGTNLYSLRSVCRQRRSSPIIFADALPVGIEHSNKDKLALRDQITSTELDEHLSSLLQMPILKRLKLIVCAGHREGTRGSSTAKDLFLQAFDTFFSYATDHGVKIIETPAMLRYNSAKIRERLLAADKASSPSVASTLSKFD